MPTTVVGRNEQREERQRSGLPKCPPQMWLETGKQEKLPGSGLPKCPPQMWLETGNQKELQTSDKATCVEGLVHETSQLAVTSPTACGNVWMNGVSAITICNSSL